MTPTLRKLALTAHITTSVGWLGTAAVFEALAIIGLTSADLPLARAAYRVMEPVVRFVIVPLAFSALLTGLAMALGTRWRLFRHFWILAKFFINTAAISLLLLHLRLIGAVARAVEDGTVFNAEMHGARIRLAAIGGAALFALTAAIALAVFKPPGLTPFGRRQSRPRQVGVNEARKAPRPPSANPVEPMVVRRLPGWVKLAVAIFFVGLAIVVALHLAGGGFPNHAH